MIVLPIDGGMALQRNDGICTVLCCAMRVVLKDVCAHIIATHNLPPQFKFDMILTFMQLTKQIGNILHCNLLIASTHVGSILCEPRLFHL